MRKLIVALIACLAMVGCGNATPAPQPAVPTVTVTASALNPVDQQFINVVRKDLGNKLSDSDADVIQSGHAACSLMQAKQYATLVDTLRFHIGLTPKETGEFAGAAGYSYCPAALNGFINWLRTQQGVVE